MPASGWHCLRCCAWAAAGCTAALTRISTRSRNALAPLRRCASKLRVNHLRVISCLWPQRLGGVQLDIRLPNRMTLAGVAVIAAAAAALVVGFGASRSGATAAGASLTVDLPPASTDKIYGAPTARDRPIVVIDPGHAARAPGARAVWGDVAEQDLALAPRREP